MLCVPEYLAARGGFRRRFLHGSRALARAARTRDGAGAQYPRALEASPADYAARGPHGPLRVASVGLGARVRFLCAAHRPDHAESRRRRGVLARRGRWTLRELGGVESLLCSTSSSSRRKAAVSFFHGGLQFLPSSTGERASPAISRRLAGIARWQPACCRESGWNSNHGSARGVVRRSRRRTPSSSATGFSVISIVVGLVF
jgi:hypothetical protein